ncbi:hypothetical protein [Clostridium sp. AM58-1XD]|uniref:hypothetical protein n=1 Tax=Clostridium sp. AM58-1XD TaxID=2292307 RepID=UPI000E4D0E01|nr:hypothetical protein [Clostridium sp. AM58-1XD]RGY96739.1 hypothetical protein DXA13_16425 [Clostridium sp. AM58-1XD]
MKKRCAGIMLAMALVASQSFCVLAAGSIQGGSSGSGGHASNSSSSSSSSSTSSTSNSSASQGPTGFVTGGSNASNSATVGDKSLSFATGEAATAGLPAAAVEAINAINKGTELASAVSGVDVSGYAALTETQAVVVKDAATQNVATGEVQVTLYVANLVENLNDVQLLFYDNVTGQWKVIQPIKVDFATKQLTVNISGSGTYTVIYKK